MGLYTEYKMLLEWLNNVGKHHVTLFQHWNQFTFSKKVRK